MRAVLVLDHEQEVEHADDPALDEVEQQRNRLAGHRSVGRIADHDDVDRPQFLAVSFHGGDSNTPKGSGHHPRGMSGRRWGMSAQLRAGQLPAQRGDLADSGADEREAGRGDLVAEVRHVGGVPVEPFEQRQRALGLQVVEVILISIADMTVTRPRAA